MSRPNTLLVLLALLFIAIASLGDRFAPHSREITAAFWPLYAVLMFSWVKAHARLHNVENVGGRAVICVLFAPVGLPVYFLSAYGWRLGSRMILRTVGFIIVVSVAISAISFVFHEQPA